MSETNGNVFVEGFSNKSFANRRRSARSKRSKIKSTTGYSLSNEYLALNIEKSEIKPQETENFNSLTNNPTSISQILWAIRFNKLDFLSKFLNKISLQERQSVLNCVENGMSPFHYAVRYGMADVVHFFLQNGADVNLLADESKQPIHWAAKFFKDIPSSIDEKEKTAMTTQNNILQLLINSGADVNARDCFQSTPLHYACLKGHASAVRILLQAKNIQLDVVNEQLSSPLLEAVTGGHFEIVKLILSFGKSGKSLIKMADESGVTPMMVSCRDGHTEIADLMLNTSKSLALDGAVQRLLDRDIDGNLALHVAVEGGSIETVELVLSTWEKEILQLGRMPNNYPNKNKSYVDLETEDGFTALHLAADLGNKEILESILNRNPQLDVANNSQRITPLHLAVKRSHLKCLEILIKRGCNIELVDFNQLSPFLTACKNGDVEIVEMLRKYGANVYVSDFRSRNGAFLAAEGGFERMFKSILEGCDHQKLMNERDSFGNSIIHEIASRGSLQLLKMILVLCDVKMNLRNDVDQTPLHVGAMNGKNEIVAEIVNWNRSTLNDNDERSRTPLHLAACNGHVMTVSLLLKLGAATADVDILGMTPLHICVARGHLECVEAILEADKFIINNVTRQKETCLHLACMNGREDIVKLLLKHSADVTARLSDGRNAMDVAIDSNNESCVMVLIDSDIWMDSMRNATTSPSSNQLTTPFRKLIQFMPNQAERVLDKCMKSLDKNYYTKDHQVQINYELLEDCYKILDWKAQTEEQISNRSCRSRIKKLGLRRELSTCAGKMQCTGNGNTRLLSDNQSKDDIEKCTIKTPDCDIAYSSSGLVLLENHPLCVMVKSKREKLLRHPVVKSLLFHKWKNYGLYVYLGNFLFYLLYLTNLNVFVWTTPPLFAIDANSTYRNFSKENFCIRVIPEAVAVWGSGCQNRRFNRYVTLVMVMAFSCFHLGRKLFQLKVQRRKFFASITNFLEVALYVLSILVFTSFDGVSRATGIRTRWQWELTAVLTLLAWINLGSFLITTPWGIYVFMVTSVGKSFLLFLPVMLIFLIGFATSFYVLLQNQNDFGTPIIAFMKTLVMTVGEFEFADSFLSKRKLYNERVFYETSTFLVFVFFLIFLSLLLTNLLVGIAVDDIALVYDQSVLKQLAVQVDSLLRIEYMIPLSIRRRIIKNCPYHIHFPNKRSSHKYASSWLGNENSESESNGILNEKTETEALYEELKCVKQSVAYLVDNVCKLKETNERRSDDMKAILKELKSIHDNFKEK